MPGRVNRCNRVTLMMRKMINVVIFQSAWFAAVLGAGNGMPWLGVTAVTAALALHLALSPDWRPELLLAFCAAILGFIVDSVLITAGAFSPVPYLFPEPLTSLWMVMLWVNLATTLNVSLGWLRGRYRFIAAFGAIGGPLAYYGGAKLGAMTRVPDTGGILGIGAAWAIALPLLYVMANMISHRASKNQSYDRPV